MYTTNLRQVGGSVMLAVPPALLDLLRLGAGASVDIGIEDGRLIVAPRTRPNYSLQELLAQCDETAPDDDADRAWLDARPCNAAGRNLACHLDPTAGHGQRGTRPVVIVSPAPFNQLTRTPVVLPITTGGNFARRRGFAVSLNDAGTRTVGVIRCDQPRILDLAARNGTRLEAVPSRSWTKCLPASPRFWRRRCSTDSIVVSGIQLDLAVCYGRPYFWNT